MIRIIKIRLKNFRLYYGLQTFEFSEEPGLSIIYGKNGCGKSSLVKAFKYAFHEELDEKSIFKIKNEINTIAWEERTYEMFVEIEFKHGDNYYLLERKVSRSHNYSGEPQSDSEFIRTVNLWENGEWLSLEKTRNLLDSIIPNNISEYVFFEGETISQYQRLLDNRENYGIYESIQKILGITILKNSVYDIEKVINILNDEIHREEKKQQKDAKEQRRMDELYEKINSYQKIVSSLKKDLEKKKLEKSEIENYLRINQRANSILEDINNNRDQINSLNNDLVGNQEQLKNILKNYKSFAVSFINNQINADSANEYILEIQTKIEKSNLLNEEIEKYSNTISSDVCQYCGSEIGLKEKGRIETKISILKNQIPYVSIEEQQVAYKHAEKSRELSKIIMNVLEYSANDLKQIEDNIADIEVNLDPLRRIEQDLKRQLEGFDEETIRKNYNNLKIIEEDIRAFEEKIKFYNTEISKDEDKYKNERDKVRINYDESIKNLMTNLDTASKINEILDKAVKKYEEKMRLNVQKDTTIFFKNAITHSEKYKQLQLDEHYGLKVIDNRNRVVPNISGGQLTVITMSLIYGLHKNSSMTGTIVLDAPISVLDNDHIYNIIRSFQQLSPQVILLLCKDHIREERVREEIRNFIINEYELYKNTENEEDDYHLKTNIRRIA